MKRSILFVLLIVSILLAGCNNPRAESEAKWYLPWTWGDKTLEQSLQEGCRGGAITTTIAGSVYTCPSTPTNTPTATPTETPTPTAPVVQPTPAASQPAATAGGYPLAGQKYTAWINGSADTSGRYDAVWTASGWLWQPNLPPEGHRKGHVLSITIEEGRYIFNGVSCRLHLDVSRNGQGANNPQTVGYGNGLAFTVNTADNGQAWAFIVCDPTDVTGFSIQYQGPLP